MNLQYSQELNHLLRENHFFIESLIEKIYSSFLKKGDVCVDGGANRGRHTVPLAKLVGDTGKVYAFEPIPQNSENLLTRLSNLGISNTILSQNALSYSDNQKCTFFQITNLPEEGGLKKKSFYSQPPQFEQITAITTTLDKVLAEEAKIRFIKLDLEGGEYHCLKGSLQTLTQKQPLLIFESGRHSTDDYGYTRDDFFALFEGVDYVLYDLLGRELTPDSWLSPELLFYSIAVKRNSQDLDFVKLTLPLLLREALRDFKGELNSQGIILHDGLVVDLTNPNDYFFVFNNAKKGQGFSSCEPTGTWTQDSKIMLNFVSEYSDKFILDFDIYWVFLTPDHNSINVKVFLNSKIVDIWRFEFATFEKKVNKFLLIDPAILANGKGEVKIELEIDFPIKPKILGISEDDRDLGLMISSISSYGL